RIGNGQTLNAVWMERARIMGGGPSSCNLQPATCNLQLANCNQKRAGRLKAWNGIAGGKRTRATPGDDRARVPRTPEGSNVTALERIRNVQTLNHVCMERARIMVGGPSTCNLQPATCNLQLANCNQKRAGRLKA